MFIYREKNTRVNRGSTPHKASQILAKLGGKSTLCRSEGLPLSIALVFSYQIWEMLAGLNFHFAGNKKPRIFDQNKTKKSQGFCHFARGTTLCYGECSMPFPMSFYQGFSLAKSVENLSGDHVPVKIPEKWAYFL